ncbi:MULTISPECIES: 50S ribosomal protein L13 [Sorangium]|jgi:large subunit ribosomal protein L13|uniref:Large ribosomal subunit protein uL13 n=1 Tax=Sorangium cellulosum TaxID=56 RepID=A0A150QGG8_SORCE|nr:50S ribosomal protein L13 [Sorangium cellulosum]KYF67097.1 50S ribosomal protein L13 [Sorangium cellulosum]KYF83369.1 50S ribosomal protein L13 [Sorangium cellulosum]
MNPQPKSFSAKPAEARNERTWWVIDAEGKPLGRLASRIAMVLRGKTKPTFTPHVDTGDFVIVVNAKKVLLTGRKLQQKNYVRHSGEPGGFRSESYGHLLERKPELPIQKAVKGMLPKNVLGRELLTKLKVYAGPDHPHAAQKPQPLSYS